MGGRGPHKAGGEAGGKIQEEEKKSWEEEEERVGERIPRAGPSNDNWSLCPSPQPCLSWQPSDSGNCLVDLPSPPGPILAP